MRYIHSWSGGKDSTAAIILNHMHNLPPPTIIFSEVMFDKQRGISGELPEHIEFVKSKAIPVFQKWGYEIEILHAEKDYLDCFHQIIRKSKNPFRNGTKNGFPIGGMCIINDRIKIKPIREYLKTIQEEFIQYVGIAADEPERLKKLENTNKVSLLAEYDYTEQMAYDLCRKYDLLSPIYQHTKRGGCWFCPNAAYGEFAYLKANYPELWDELRRLSKDKNLSSQNFKYSKTFAEVDEKIDNYISKQNLRSDFNYGNNSKN